MAMRRLGPVSRPSEIWLIRPWHVGVLSRVPLNVFGANLFRPVVGAQSISHGRGPRHREDALILDGELELQVFAPMVRVPHPLSDVTLLCVPFEALFRRLVLSPSGALGDVASLVQPGAARPVPLERVQL